MTEKNLAESPKCITRKLSELRGGEEFRHNSQWYRRMWPFNFNHNSLEWCHDRKSLGDFAFATHNGVDITLFDINTVVETYPK